MECDFGRTLSLTGDRDSIGRIAGEIPIHLNFFDSLKMRYLLSSWRIHRCHRAYQSSHCLRCSSSSSKSRQSTGFFFHFNDPPFNINSLTARIEHSGLLSENASNKPPLNPQDVERLLMDAIESCKSLHRLNYANRSLSTSSKRQDTHDLKIALARSKRFKAPLDLLSEVMEKNMDKLTYEPMRLYLCSQPFPDTIHAIRFLKAFCHGDSSKKRINETRQLIDIGLRRALLRREIKLAYDIIDIIEGKVAKFSWSSCINQHALLSSFSMSVMGAGCITIVTSLTSLPLGVAVGSIAGLWLTQFALYVRAVSTRTRVRWKSGLSLPIWTRLQRSYELELVNRVAVEYDELVDLTVDNFHHFANLDSLPSADSKVSLSDHAAHLRELQDFQRSQLVKRKMRLVETDQELMFNEYWTRAGEGFQWVEPDQDPADPIVKQIRNK